MPADALPWGPVTLACLAAGVGVLFVAAANLLRERPPAFDRHAPVASRGGADQAVRALGRPGAAVLTRRPWLYTRVVSRWLRQTDATTSMSVREFAEGHVGVAITGGVVAAVLGRLGSPPLVVAAVALVAVVFPVAQLWQQVVERRREIERSLPAFLELMSVLLAAGMTFRQGLARVSPRLSGPLQREMTVLLEQLELGFTPGDAFEDLLQRTSAPTVMRLVAIVRQNLSLGVPVAQSLSDLAAQTRADATVRLKLEAERAATKGSMVLVFLTMPAVLGLVIGILASDLIDGFAGFL